MVDFSKLVAGSAESKLMIVRQPTKRQPDAKRRTLEFIGKMAPAVGGDLFLVFLPAYPSGHADLETYWKTDKALPFDLAKWSGTSFNVLQKGWADQWPGM